MERIMCPKALSDALLQLFVPSASQRHAYQSLERLNAFYKSLMQLYISPASLHLYMLLKLAKLQESVSSVFKAILFLPGIFGSSVFTFWDKLKV